MGNPDTDKNYGSFCMNEKNYTLEKSFFTSADGENRIAYYIFAPKTDVRAVLQLSHGMCEYILRYEMFADYLAGQGIAVCGNDHLGHGYSAKSDVDLGFTSNKKGARHILADLVSMTEIIKEKYPGVPVFLLGHSMGSFFARVYAARNGGKISGLILSGTAGNTSPTGLARILARLNILFCGGRNRSDLLYRLTIGSYRKKSPKGSENGWLSGDAEIRKKYDNDKFCNFRFTSAAYRDMFDALHEVSRGSWAKKLPCDLPVLITSGDRDPVGANGRGVRQVYSRLVSAGMTDVTLKLWENMRHEVLNEVDRQNVYEYITDWLNTKVNDGKNKGN